MRQLLTRGRPRLTYANVISTLALLVALGGTSYAAATIGARDIQRGAVRTHHVQNSAITLAKISPATRRALRGLRGARGPVGATGAPGAAGAAGAQGPQGPAGPPGVNGSNGTNGSDGADGADGTTIDTLEALDGIACQRDGKTGSLTITVSAATGAVTLTCTFPAAPSGGSIAHGGPATILSPATIDLTFDLGSAPAGIDTWRIERTTYGVNAELGTFLCIGGSATTLATQPAGTTLQDSSLSAGSCNVYTLVVTDSVGQTTTYESDMLHVDIDADEDGYYIISHGDCDDSMASIHPGAVEVADGLDNDCDGDIDEGLL